MNITCVVFVKILYNLIVCLEMYGSVILSLNCDLITLQNILFIYIKYINTLLLRYTIS